MVDVLVQAENMNRLLALPVPGESFLLQRGGKNVLVDGGYRSSKLTAALSAISVAAHDLDIVVCTHADCDHAGGLVKLLHKPCKKVPEFWLPGEWGNVLPGLLGNPEVVMVGLLSELHKMPHWATELGQPQDGGQITDADEALIERNLGAEYKDQSAPDFREEIRPSRENFDPSEGSRWLIRLFEEKVSDRQAAATFRSARGKVQGQVKNGKVSKQWGLLFFDAIRTAERIRAISVQAVRYRANVRWFDFQSFIDSGSACGGNTGLLVPLNSREVDVPPVPNGNLSYLTRLTPLNERSLVFLSREVGGESGGTTDVIFTADSPLGSGQNYAQSFLPDAEPARWAVATAPHHGSENNRMAYGHLNQMVSVLLWVRSGGTRAHPGRSFQSLSMCQRACTHCPHNDYPRSVVEIPLQILYHAKYRPYFFSGMRSHCCSCWT